MSKADNSDFLEKLSVLSHKEEFVELAVDLNDIYESNKKVDLLIKQILDSSLAKEELSDKLIDIEMELDHINWHYKSLKKELKKL